MKDWRDRIKKVVLLGNGFSHEKVWIDGDNITEGILISFVEQVEKEAKIEILKYLLLKDFNHQCTDNGMYILAMFDIYNQKRLLNRLTDKTRQEIIDRLDVDYLIYLT